MSSTLDRFGICFCVLFLAGCGHVEDPKPDFAVTVTSSAGEPLPGTRIQGGVDWTAFSVITDSLGHAILPGSARGQTAIFAATNYLPLQERLHSNTTYELLATDKIMVQAGAALGKVITFKDGLLLTLEYNGRYHAYRYGSGGVIEESALNLEPLAQDIKVVQNTFWMTTFNSGVRAYSIEEPRAPSLIVSLPVEGYLGALAVSDSLLAIAAYCPGPIRLFGYQAGQVPVLRATIRNYCVNSLDFLEQYLVLTGGWDALPVVFDVSDSQDPRMVYNGIEPEFQSGFLYRQRLVLLPRDWRDRNTLLQLYVPSDPKYQVSFYADSYVKALIDDFNAVGGYPLGGISIMKGSLASYFSTIAFVAETMYYEGSDPPYYKLDDAIWKLEEPAGASASAGSFR